MCIHHRWCIHELSAPVNVVIRKLWSSTGRFLFFFLRRLGGKQIAAKTAEGDKLEEVEVKEGGREEGRGERGGEDEGQKNSLSC